MKRFVVGVFLIVFLGCLWLWYLMGGRVGPYQLDDVGFAGLPPDHLVLPPVTASSWVDRPPSVSKASTTTTTVVAAPAPAPVAAPPVVEVSSQTVVNDGGLGGHPFLVCTRRHESDTAGGYQAVSPSGAFRGAYQFHQATWDTVAGWVGRPDLVGVPADLASPADQDLLAFELYRREGNRHWEGRC